MNVNILIVDESTQELYYKTFDDVLLLWTITQYETM